MLKNKYVKPMFLEANGTITMTVSQLAALGVGDVDSWEDFWEASSDIISENFPDFNVNNRSTWPAGFDLADPTTWDVLIGF
jgi:hypothetical protein